jgi:hypothetical protein
MAETNEPRALTAALAGPAFQTKAGGLAMHAANRHVDRWAPEAGANRMRPLRNIGFVDRLVAPWIEASQRSQSMRLFSQYHSNGMAEHTGSQVSWVFPRPWFQDELDWMAASRTVGAQTAMGRSQAPSMLTTRGTYVSPTQPRAELALPAALYEYVAPSLSLAREAGPALAGEAYSPLVSAASAHAAQVMNRVVAPLSSPNAAARMSPGLRSVLSTMLERTAQSSAGPTRLAEHAPELVTPPAPRPEARAA